MGTAQTLHRNIHVAETASAIEAIVVNDGNGSECGLDYDGRVELGLKTIAGDKSAFAKWIGVAENAAKKHRMAYSEADIYAAASSIREYYVRHLLDMAKHAKEHLGGWDDRLQRRRNSKEAIAEEARESFSHIGAPSANGGGIFERINSFYGLDIEIGTRVKTEDDKFGTVVGTENGKNLSGNCLAVNLDEDLPSTTRFLHATALSYHPSDDPKLETSSAASTFRP